MYVTIIRLNSNYWLKLRSYYNIIKCIDYYNFKHVISLYPKSNYNNDNNNVIINAYISFNLYD
jgi:hypothetical protein